MRAIEDALTEQLTAGYRTAGMYVPTKGGIASMTAEDVARGLCGRSGGRVAVCRACKARCAFGRQAIRLEDGPSQSALADSSPGGGALGTGEGAEAGAGSTSGGKAVDNAGERRRQGWALNDPEIKRRADEARRLAVVVNGREKAARLTELMAEGMSLTAAAAKIRCSRKSARKWLDAYGDAADAAGAAVPAGSADLAGAEGSAVSADLAGAEASAVSAGLADSTGLAGPERTEVTIMTEDKDMSEMRKELGVPVSTGIVAEREQPKAVAFATFVSREKRVRVRTVAGDCASYTLEDGGMISLRTDPETLLLDNSGRGYRPELLTAFAEEILDAVEALHG